MGDFLPLSLETVLMIDTYVAVAVALYVVVLGALGVVPWIPTAIGAILAAFLVPVVGPLLVLGLGIWLHVRHHRGVDA